MNHKAHEASNFNQIIETKGPINVTGSHVDYKSGNLSERM